MGKKKKKTPSCSPRHTRPFLVREKVVGDSRSPLGQFLHQLPGLKQPNPILVQVSLRRSLFPTVEERVSADSKISRRRLWMSPWWPKAVEPSVETPVEDEPLVMGEQLENFLSVSLNAKQTHLQNYKKLRRKLENSSPQQTLICDRLWLVLVFLAIVLMATLFVVTTKMVEHQFFTQNPRSYLVKPLQALKNRCFLV